MFGPAIFRCTGDMLGSTQGKSGTDRHLLRVTVDLRISGKGQNSGTPVNIKKANGLPTDVPLVVAIESS